MITEYQRPGSLDEAVALVATPGSTVIVEATSLTHAASHEAAVAIDLQSLGLDGIEISDETTHIGSMATVADMADSRIVPRMISELSVREYPNTIRNAATIGGVIATNDSESELLAGLVAFDASVTVASAQGERVHPIETILATPQILENSLIVDVSLGTRGAAVAHRTGRTPMDRPIVMVVGHKDNAGHIRLAITGVAAHVVALSPGQVGTLDPPADFRGSSQYRKNLATVLTKRVLADLSVGGAT
jgi:CO/xanthine dehydrogenase FAD-binding subunit